MKNSGNSSPPIDKDELYGQNTRSHLLHEQVVRKAMDLPEDMNNNTFRNGLGWKELLAVAAIVFGVAYYSKQEAALPPPAPSPEAAVDTDTTRSVRIEKYIPPTD